MPEIQARLKAGLGRALNDGHSISAVEGDQVIVKRAVQRERQSIGSIGL
jgi:hypothetical protein